ncbi:hypothetical protein KY386_00440 [Candidatus Parcubacteria bacterium]|nr:hypothetical protein [Candidatus Parcubacteria bacterium]
MIAKIVYTKGSPHEREAGKLAESLARLRIDSKLVEADSPEGSSICQLYDLVARPAVVLTRDDGTLVERWQGGWPLASEISYLAHS